MRANILTRIIAGSYLAIAIWVVCSPEPTVPADGPDVAMASPVFVRVVAKTVVARELLAGRLSLPEATAVFDWLNRLPPALSDDVRARAGADPEESPYRAVLNWVELPAGANQSVPNVRRLIDLQEEQRQSEARSPLQLPAVIEDDCSELVERSRAAIRPGSGCACDRVTIDGLRLVEGRRD
jgi:hypothetical protein